MKIYVLKRILSTLVIMWAVATIVFICMRVIPSDPAQVVLGNYATAEALKAFRHDMGLDRPLWVQYAEFIRISHVYRADEIIRAVHHPDQTLYQIIHKTKRAGLLSSAVNGYILL